MENISVEELRKRMENDEKINLIDVREPDEFAEFNIGGKLIPLGKIQTMQVDEIEDLKEEEVILHCKSGKRSLTAGLFLEMIGFKNIKNLAGGVVEWQQKFPNYQPGTRR